MQMMDLGRQRQRIQAELDKRMSEVMNSGKFIMGPEVKELEERLKNYVGCRHAIACANGTDALTLALMAIDIQPGDEVITTPFSFISTAEAIVQLRATPVFVDIDEQTYNIDPEKIEAAITYKTKAIIAVSLYGQTADFDRINQIADKHDLVVIEDGAQSFGAEYKGKRSGNLSELATTSFFPSKPLGCYGDGGAVFTSNDELAERISQIRLHGQLHRYEHIRVGVNSRLDTLQAAVLLCKLDIFDAEIKARNKAARLYDSLLKDVVKTPLIEEQNLSVYAQYTIQVDQRDRLQKELKDSGIPTAVHYPKVLNEQEAIKGFLKGNESMPLAEMAAKKVLSLPMHPYLEANEIEAVAEQIKKFARAAA